MKVFTVYAPPDTGADPAGDALRMAFIKDGFCWPALVVPLLWLLWHRMWLTLLGWLGAAAAIALVTATVSWAEPFATPAALLFAFWFALEANGLRRWTLERHGWRFAGLASGRNRFECEHGFFQRWLDRLPAARPERQSVVPPVPKAPRRPGDSPVIGLFPRAE